MGKFLDDIHQLIMFLAAKNIATKYPPEKIDLVVYDVSLSIFVNYLDHYVKTEKIERFLEPFMRITTINVNSGVASLPGDFAHFRYATLPNGKIIEKIADLYWPKRLERKLGGPSLSRPILNIDDLGGDSQEIAMRVAPADGITSLVLHYFKTVGKPKWAYDVSGSRYVYNESKTVDIEWDAQLLPEIKAKVLSSLGINLRERDLIQYSEMIKTQEGNK